MVVFCENVFIRIKYISVRNIFPVYVVFHGLVISNILTNDEDFQGVTQSHALLLHNSLMFSIVVVLPSSWLRFAFAFSRRGSEK